jgi:hypothetical protein
MRVDAPRWGSLAQRTLRALHTFAHYLSAFPFRDLVHTFGGQNQPQPPTQVVRAKTAPDPNGSHVALIGFKSLHGVLAKGRSGCRRGHGVTRDLERALCELPASSGTGPCRLQCVALQLHCTHLEGPFLDDQITVRLPTSLGRTLRRTCRRLGRRPSDVVRMALEAFFQAAPSADRKPAERVDHLIGSLSSGVPDLAERHRDYVLAALKHAR